MNTSPFSQRPKNDPLSNRREWLKTILLAGVSGPFLGSSRLWANEQPAKDRALHANLFSHASGEWGTLKYERLVLEPDENILDVASLERQTPWFFKDQSPAQLTTLLQSFGVAETGLASISATQIEARPEGTLFTPNAEIVTKLSLAAREKIYNTLLDDAEYRRRTNLFLFGPDYLDLTLAQTKLSTTTVQLFRSLLYKRGNLLAFSDAPVVLKTLPDLASKTAFLKMLVRRPALSIHLKLDATPRSNGWLDYWSVHERAKEVRMAIQRFVPSGTSGIIDIAELLPSLVRQRLNTFPNSKNKTDTVRNCHWTSLNFFNSPPNDNYLFIEEVEKELQSNYAKINSPPQLGDVVLFRNKAHEIVHSAAFVADNVVFTKNGEGPSQPWCFMRVTEVIDLYTALQGAMSVKVYRRRVS